MDKRGLLERTRQTRSSRAYGLRRDPERVPQATNGRSRRRKVVRRVVQSAIGDSA